MADIVQDPRLADQELRAHQETFRGFNKMILFAILHILLVLACLALAFLGNVPLLALLLGVGGTIGMIAVLAISN